MDEKTRSQRLSKPWQARRHKAAPEARHRLRGVVPHGATLEKHQKRIQFYFFGLIYIPKVPTTGHFVP